MFDEESEKKVGVYLLHNRQTDQGYVGSTNDLDGRGKAHFKLLEAGKHPNRRLQAAYTANPNFDFVGLALGDREAAFDYEQELLEELGPSAVLLNISRNARYCRVEGLQHTEETKAKISAASKGHKHNLGRKHPPEFGAAISERLKGHLTSEETRRKIAATKIGKPMPAEAVEKMRQTKIGVKQSPESVAKRSEALRGKTRTPEQIQMYREVKASVAKKVSIDGVVYGGLNEAARVLDINPGLIHRRVNSDNYPTWFYETA